MLTKIFPGQPYPLGATWDGKGVNFAIYAGQAEKVELCLFISNDDKNEYQRISLPERSNQIWHVYLPDAQPGLLYGYRVYGNYEPDKGLRYNPNKLLLDPYAKAIAGSIDWHDALFGYEIGTEEGDRSFSTLDSAAFIPKSVVINPMFDWEGDKAPRVPYDQSIIYEAHVKGFTELHPDIPEHIRGTYSAICHSVTIDYLKKLGITAIELMPVQQLVNDRHLAEKGLRNYWGYNTIGFFAPEVRYSAKGVLGEQVIEFKQMVKELHRAGIEVILDVVYNHTGEGSERGPTLSFRGIENSSYYRLKEDDPRFYMDYTGTGNTLNAMQPSVLRFIMDSLRYWVLEMHVDGFRFDLAATLARELHEVNRLSAFFDIIHQDPVISQVKLIAEPWDVGEGGYQVGKFPPGWAEWNGIFRDCIRDYWRGADSMLGEFALRFTGSPDLYQEDFRRPTASINFITAHDGYTLQDLVSYNERHNEANGEDNQDGEKFNQSWNCGAEGPTDDVEINKLRMKQKRNLMTTLFLSQGIPMLVAGDEIGRTQQGNNNAYCQDNEISWLNWATADHDFLAFIQKLIAIRKVHPAFRRLRWFQGEPVRTKDMRDIAWFLPEGIEMTEENWSHDFAKSLGVFLNGRGLNYLGPNGEQIMDDNFYVIFNAHDEALDYILPRQIYSEDWIKILDTDESKTEEKTLSPNQPIKVQGRSVILLQHAQTRNS